MQFDVYLNLVGPTDPEVDALEYVVPGAPQYQQYLDLDQATTSFGADAATREAIVTEVERAGGTVSFGPTNTYAALSVDAAGASALFSTTFDLFGESGCPEFCVIAPADQPTLPQPWVGKVDAVAGLLSIIATPPPGTQAPLRSQSSTQATPTRTGTPSGCEAGLQSGGFSPSQLATAYGVDDLRSRGLSGAGVRLAVLELGGNVSQADLDTFTECFDLPATTIRQVNVGGEPLPSPAWVEATLDVQVVAQVAPGLEAFDLYSYNGNPTAPRSSFLEMMALPLTPSVYDAAPPDIVSVSYILCEVQSWEGYTPVVRMMDRLLASASTTGMSYLVATSDSGSSSCLHEGVNDATVNPAYPATSAWVTAVGGTGLTLAPDNTIVDESVWNDTLFPPPYFSDNSAGTGGVSRIVPRPPWQQGATVPSGEFRMVPDVAMYADSKPGWIVHCGEEVCGGFPKVGFLTLGGTSAATPLFAAMLALITEQSRGLGEPDLGLVSPLLYDLADAGSPALRDVTTGNNAVTDVDCCEATVGFDLASGWGSVNASLLVQALYGPQGAPTDLRVVDGYGSSAIMVTPPPSPSSPVVNYEYSLDGGATWTALDPPVGATARSVVIPDLPNGVTTEALLRAVNAAGPGPATAPIPLNPAGAVFTPIEPVRVFDSRTQAGGGPLQPGQPRNVRVDGPGALPAGAIAAVYNVTVTGTEGSGFLTVGPVGSALSDTSTLNWLAPNQTLANGYVSAINYQNSADDGQLQLVADGGATQAVLDLVGYYATEAVTPSGALFTPISPARAYDSRDGDGPLSGGDSRTVDATAGGIVPESAVAVAFTLTETGTRGTGYLSVAPAGIPEPVTSTLNWATSGQTMANSSTVGLTDGEVTVYAGGSGSTEFILDIIGYYSPASATPDGARFTALNPVRAYDSRVAGAGGPLAVGQSRTTSILVAGTQPAPMPPGMTAVAFNLTETGTIGSGFLTVTPGGTEQPPLASTINWTGPNVTMANGTVGGVSTDSITTFAGGRSGSAQYVVDLAGYFN